MINFDEMYNLCRQYSSLNVEDIDYLVGFAHMLENTNDDDDIDIFIDIYNEITRQAVVIYHRPPRRNNSLYEERIVGKEARIENEPGALRTLATGLPSHDILALTQEDKIIKQTIFPIIKDMRNIAVLIFERSAEIPLDEPPDRSGNPALLNDGEFLVKGFQNRFVNQLHEAILVFGDDGNLQLANSEAVSLYHKIGYRDSIVGMTYDNLSLDRSTFRSLWQQLTRKEEAEYIKVETHYFYFWFSIKKVYLKEESKLLLLIQDITDIKKKEEEINLKTSVIQEIHHRVKNNLQSVVSLLRIQARRTDNDSARKALEESVGRIMAIAGTHELLSKQISDEVSLNEVINHIVGNFRKIYSINRIQIETYVDENIYLNSDQMVSIAIICNELIQNVFEHAYDEHENGKIMIKGFYDEQEYILVSVEDNGKGYNSKNVRKNSLGKTLVESYVKEKLNGKLIIQSNNKGTKTSFYFNK
ncbi:MAG: sensor histidine kinase [Lactobacillales bacterium]|jgi:two-component sensor histidine kinase|nr:sensor histidine kinase [Lactobacillales bacterium]